MSREWRVAWVIDVEAESARDAAAVALQLHRDEESIATVFNVAKRCSCGEFHPDEVEMVDLDADADVGSWQ